MRFLRRRRCPSPALHRWRADRPSGFVAPEHVFSVDEPSCANCTSSSAPQSTLAPESRKTIGFRAVGKIVTIAGRLDAGVQLEHDHRRGHLRAGVAGGDERVRFPSACSFRPTIIELLGFPRIAAPGLSVISMTSGASTMKIRSRCAASGANSASREQRVELLGDDRRASDELNRVRGSSSPRASNAPATVAWGAKSPPMASNAMRAKATLPWLRPAAYRRSTRTRRTRGADASSAALRALLNRDGGRRLVGVAGALLPLGGTSLRDGHGTRC